MIIRHPQGSGVAFATDGLADQLALTKGAQGFWRQARLGHVVVVQAVFGLADQGGSAGVAVVVLDDQVGLVDVVAFEGDVQILANALAGDVLGRAPVGLVDQFVTHELLRLQAQRLAPRAIAGLKLMLRQRLADVVDVDLDFHFSTSL